ncbi:MAG: LPP20 family lipoprotein [Fidelibacterota bacterium]
MKYFIITLTVTLILAGCGGPKSSSGSTEAGSFGDAPKWFMNPPKSKDKIYAVGAAKKQNPSLALNAATQRARDEIARSITVKVQNMMKDFMQESGVGENAQALEFSESVSKQVANVSLSGSVRTKTATGKDGTIYVLVEYPLDGVRQAALDEAKKQEALYNEFKANQGFKELEEAIRNLK